MEGYFYLHFTEMLPCGAAEFTWFFGMFLRAPVHVQIQDVCAAEDTYLH